MSNIIGHHIGQADPVTWPDSGSNDVCQNDGRTNDSSTKRHLFEREKSETTFVRKVISQKRYKSQPIFVRKNTISKCHSSEWSFVRRNISSNISNIISKRHQFEMLVRNVWGVYIYIAFEISKKITRPVGE